MKKLLGVSVILLLALACGPYDTSQLEDPAKAELLARVIIMEYEKNPILFERERMAINSVCTVKSAELRQTG